MTLKKAQRLCLGAGADLEDFSQTEAALTAEQGGIPSPRDVYWTLANARTMELALRREWHQLSSVYFQMALTLREEGQPHQHILMEASVAQIREYQDRAVYAVKGVQIIASQGCDTWRELHGRQYNFDAALRAPPIPNPACTNGWCRCSWRAWLDRM